MSDSRSSDAIFAEHDAMRVVGWEWSVETLPLARDLHHAGTRTSGLVAVVGRLTTAAGTGCAEVRANAAYGTGENPADVVAALRGVPAGGRTVAQLATALSARSRLAALLVDLAAWDVTGRAAGVPLAVLLGGAAGAFVATHGQIPFGTAVEAAELASGYVTGGLRRLKIRVGAADPVHDLRRVRSVREAVGADIDIAADANGGWDTDTAVSAARGLSDLGVRWLEQPTGSVEGLAVVRRDGAVHVRADESAHSAAGMASLASVADGVHIKLEKTGSVRALFAAEEAARAAGLDVALGQFDQGRLGSAATLHMAVAIGLDHAELWGFANVVDDLAGPLELDGPGMTLPPGTGLGLDLHTELEWSHAT